MSNGTLWSTVSMSISYVSILSGNLHRIWHRLEQRVLLNTGAANVNEKHQTNDEVLRPTASTMKKLKSLKTKSFEHQGLAEIGFLDRNMDSLRANASFNLVDTRSSFCQIDDGVCKKWRCSYSQYVLVAYCNWLRFQCGKAKWSTAAQGFTQLLGFTPLRMVSSDKNAELGRKNIRWGVYDVRYVYDSLRRRLGVLARIVASGDQEEVEDGKRSTQ